MNRSVIGKNRPLIFTTIVLNIFFALSSFFTAFAVDIPLEIYIQGGLTLNLNGDYFSGLVMDPLEVVSGFSPEQTTYWTSVDLEDFISLADDTSTSGFYLMLSTSDYEYSGSSQTQGPIVASNVSIYGNYSESGPAPANIGIDDETKTFSILPDSCQGATVDKFTLHSSFSDTQSDYALIGNNNDIIILTSTANCLVKGNLRFDKIKFILPEFSESGDYSSTFTLTIVDGTP